MDGRGLPARCVRYLVYIQEEIQAPDVERGAGREGGQ
jgi:hypothetical protein